MNIGYSEDALNRIQDFCSRGSFWFFRMEITTSGNPSNTSCFLVRGFKKYLRQGSVGCYYWMLFGYCLTQFKVACADVFYYFLPLISGLVVLLICTRGVFTGSYPFLINFTILRFSRFYFSHFLSAICVTIEYPRSNASAISPFSSISCTSAQVYPLKYSSFFSFLSPGCQIPSMKIRFFSSMGSTSAPMMLALILSASTFISVPSAPSSLLVQNSIALAKQRYMLLVFSQASAIRQQTFRQVGSTLRASLQASMHSSQRSSLQQQRARLLQAFLLSGWGLDTQRRYMLAARAYSPYLQYSLPFCFRFICIQSIRVLQISQFKDQLIGFLEHLGQLHQIFHFFLGLLLVQPVLGVEYAFLEIQPRQDVLSIMSEIDSLRILEVNQQGLACGCDQLALHFFGVNGQQGAVRVPADDGPVGVGPEAACFGAGLLMNQRILIVELYCGPGARHQ